MAWVSKAYYALAPVIRQVKLVYHVTMGTSSWGITLPILSRGSAGARAVSHAPSSGSVRQPLGRASQISQQGSGDLLCMGNVNWVYTVQRQPPIYSTGHGSNSGTNVLGMVGKGTLIYPAGGPTRAAPGRDPTPKGGGAPPPPPSTDPKIVVRNNVLCRRRRRRRFCFRYRAGGNFFVRPYVSVLKILRISWKIQKWLKSPKKDFDPDPASGSDLG